MRDLSSLVCTPIHLPCDRIVFRLEMELKLFSFVVPLGCGIADIFSLGMTHPTTVFPKKRKHRVQRHVSTGGLAGVRTP